MTSKKKAAQLCERFHKFCPNFGQILPGFLRNQKFWGCGCTPASFTSAWSTNFCFSQAESSSSKKWAFHMSGCPLLSSSFVAFLCVSLIFCFIVVLTARVGSRYVVDAVGDESVPTKTKCELCTLRYTT